MSDFGIGVIRDLVRGEGGSSYVTRMLRDREREMERKRREEERLKNMQPPKVHFSDSSRAYCNVGRKTFAKPVLSDDWGKVTCQNCTYLRDIRKIDF